MAEVLHQHDAPSFGLMVDAIRAHERGDDAHANFLIRPWSCCPRGLVLLIGAHFMAARMLGEYAGASLVYSLPTYSQDADPRAVIVWADAASIRGQFLTGDVEAAVARLTTAVSTEPEAPAALLSFAALALTDALKLTPGGVG